VPAQAAERGRDRGRVLASPVAHAHGQLDRLPRIDDAVAVPAELLTDPVEAHGKIGRDDRELQPERADPRLVGDLEREGDRRAVRNAGVDLEAERDGVAGAAARRNVGPGRSRLEQRHVGAFGRELAGDAGGRGPADVLQRDAQLDRLPRVQRAVAVPLRAAGSVVVHLARRDDEERPVRREGERGMGGRGHVRLRAGGGIVVRVPLDPVVASVVPGAEVAPPGLLLDRADGAVAVVPEGAVVARGHRLHEDADVDLAGDVGVGSGLHRGREGLRGGVRVDDQVRRGGIAAAVGDHVHVVRGDHVLPRRGDVLDIGGAADQPLLLAVEEGELHRVLEREAGHHARGLEHRGGSAGVVVRPRRADLGVLGGGVEVGRQVDDLGRIDQARERGDDVAPAPVVAVDVELGLQAVALELLEHPLRGLLALRRVVVTGFEVVQDLPGRGVRRLRDAVDDLLDERIGFPRDGGDDRRRREGTQRRPHGHAHRLLKAPQGGGRRGGEPRRISRRREHDLAGETQQHARRGGELRPIAVLDEEDIERLAGL